MKISPSVLACDLSRLHDEVKAMEQAGAEMIHLDVMDGHFVPNLTFGAPVIQSLRAATQMLFDVHLMISDPLAYVDSFADAGADILTFHVEAESDVERTIDCIRGRGKQVGLSLKPGTPAGAVLPYLERLDLLLVMTVEPGFGGQKFMPGQMDKLGEIAAAAAKVNPNMYLQVDGGIDAATAPIVAAHGANVLVAGSALYGQKDYKAAVNKLRRSAEVAG